MTDCEIGESTPSAAAATAQSPAEPKLVEMDDVSLLPPPPDGGQDSSVSYCYRSDAMRSGFAVDDDFADGGVTDCEVEECDSDAPDAAELHASPVASDSAAVAAASEDREDGPAYSSLQYGFISKYTYEHNNRLGEILGVCYNSRYRKFLIIDHKGVTSWMFETLSGQTSARLMNYPKYKYRLYSNILYTRKHNVYFALGRDFSLKILNSDFEETYTVDANLRNVMFLLFNPQTDELITGGVGGTKVWSFAQVQESKGWKNLRAMANYKLVHKYTLQNVGGGWVKKVELDHALQHLYCCSETDLYAYDLEGNELFAYRNAHDMSITGCVFSTYAQLLVTSSMDGTVKCWGIQGGLVQTFRGHSKPVTQLLVHPDSSALIISSSLDASVRVWSLHTMECIYSITVSLTGIQWMGLTDDNMLYTCTDRQLALWSLNHFTHFFGLTRSNAIHISQHLLESKTARTLVISEDSCVRLFSPGHPGCLAATAERRSTVLPMPCLQPSERLLGLAYSRELNLVYCLVTPAKLWMYTVRTDPACRIAHWNLAKIQAKLLSEQFDGEALHKKKGPQSGGMLPLWLKKLAATTRALQVIHPGSAVSPCRCICILTSPVVMWAKDGQCSPRSRLFLLLGLDDGRIMFMDPFVRGRRHMDFKANKDPIVDMRHDQSSDSLMTTVSGAGIASILIWSLPDLDLLHELHVFKSLVHYTRMDSVFFCGYNDGGVSFQFLMREGNETQRIALGQIKNEDDLVGANLVQKRYEHTSPIVAVDSCASRKIFLSCSGDGVIKIWSADTCAPASEVIMNGPVSTAGFLNYLGDIIIGFQKNIFYIQLRKACPAAAQSLMYKSDGGSTETLAESDIYEDAAVRFEGVLSSAEPLTLRTYLKPYELAFTKEFVEGTTVIKTEFPGDEASSATSDEETLSSAASTQVYLSPFITPGVSTFELAFAHEVDENLKVNRYDLNDDTFDVLDVTHPLVTQQYFPLFGQSPGGSPTLSSPSPPPASSDGSQLEDDDEAEDVDAESRPTFDKHSRAAVAGVPAAAAAAAAAAGAAASQKKSAPPGAVQTTRSTGVAGDIGQEPFQRKSILDGIKITLDRVSTPPAALKSRFTLEGSMKLDTRPAAKATAKKPEEKIEKRTIQAERDQKEQQQRNGGVTQTRPVKKKKASEVRKRPAAARAKTFDDEDSDAAKKPPLEEPAESPAPNARAQSRAESSVVSRPKNESIVLAPATDYSKDLKMPQSSKGASRQVVPSASSSSTTSALSSQRKRATVVGQRSMSAAANPDAKLAVDVILPQAELIAKAESEAQPESPAKFRSRLPPPRERFRSAPSLEPTPASPEMVGGELSVGTEDELTDDQRRALRLPQLPEGGSSLDVLNRWIMLAGGSEGSTNAASEPGADGGASRHSDSKSGALPQSRTGPGRSSSQVFMRLSQSQAGSRQRRAAGMKNASPRPWTSPPEPGNIAVDLLQEFENALLRFQGDKDVLKLLKFAGIAFDDHWHEKIIERHRLLLMQKNMRAESVASNRRFLLEKRNERLRMQLGMPFNEADCSIESMPSADAFMRLLSKYGGDSSSRAVTGSDAVFSPSLPATHHWRSESVVSRSAPGSGGSGAATVNNSASLAESKARRAIESNTQYRYRMKSSADAAQSPSAIGSPTRSAYQSRGGSSGGGMDARTVDPRNPEVLRPHSSRSIPSKCTRYILVRRHPDAGTDSIVATSLESQLLRQRFPDTAERIMRDKLLKKSLAAVARQPTASVT